jgi:ribosomal protein S18 acetylase RimI-like enzyme
LSDQPVTISALTPDRLDDYLTYFDTDAFPDNPKWASCYCQFMFVDHREVDWEKRTAAENRADACERICAGRMAGLLAYRDGKVVGWCNAAPRWMMAAYADAPDEPDADRLGHITCFVVAPGARRTGVARALLGAACEQLKASGLSIVEAMPVDNPRNDAEAHHGPISLYQAAGFTVHRRDEHGRVIMRLSLV